MNIVRNDLCPQIAPSDLTTFLTIISSSIEQNTRITVHCVYNSLGKLGEGVTEVSDSTKLSDSAKISDSTKQEKDLKGMPICGTMSYTAKSCKGFM